MALLFIDGFDHGGTWLLHSTKYTSVSGGSNAAIVTTPARTGAGALQNTDVSVNRGGYAIPSGTPVIAGVAFRFPAAPASDHAILLIQDTPGALNHLLLVLTSTRRLSLQTGVGVTFVQGNTVLAVDTWYYLEFKTSVHPSTGTYEVRIDGVVEMQGSGNTSGGGANVITSVIIGSPGAGQSWYFDDFYICDGTGPAPQNTFLGPVRIETLLPQTDAVQAGSNAGLTPSQGTDHGALVDEVPPNTSDYNASATVGAKDTYNYPPMTLHGAILGVQTVLYVQKSDAAARTVCAVLRSGGADYDGANVAPATTYKYFSEARGLNPAGATAWTESAIAALEAGMKVTG
jgi:hypothetical protein